MALPATVVVPAVGSVMHVVPVPSVVPVMAIVPPMTGIFPVFIVLPVPFELLVPIMPLIPFMLLASLLLMMPPVPFGPLVALKALSLPPFPLLLLVVFGVWHEKTGLPIDAIGVTVCRCGAVVARRANGPPGTPSQHQAQDAQHDAEQRRHGAFSLMRTHRSCYLSPT